MPQAKDVVLAQLASSEFMISQLTADMSDEEYFKIAVPGTNHPAWLVGHVAVSHDRMSSACCGKETRTDQSTQELFRAGTICHPEASKYPPRSVIDTLYRENHAHAIELLTGFDEGKWDDPSPEGWSKEIFPTIGTIWSLVGVHPFWHVGHLTVCRKALGKKGVLG